VLKLWSIQIEAAIYTEKSITVLWKFKFDELKTVLIFYAKTPASVHN